MHPSLRPHVGLFLLSLWPFSTLYVFHRLLFNECNFFRTLYVMESKLKLVYETISALRAGSRESNILPFDKVLIARSAEGQEDKKNNKTQTK